MEKKRWTDFLKQYRSRFLYMYVYTQGWRRDRTGLMLQQWAIHTDIHWQSCVTEQVLICKDLPLSEARPACTHLPPRTSLVRNSIIIAPLSLPPVWHPYLRSIFSGKKTTAFFLLSVEADYLGGYKSIKSQPIFLCCIVFLYLTAKSCCCCV